MINISLLPVILSVVEKLPEIVTAVEQGERNSAAATDEKARIISDIKTLASILEIVAGAL